MEEEDLHFTLNCRLLPGCCKCKRQQKSKNILLEWVAKRKALNQRGNKEQTKQVEQRLGNNNKIISPVMGVFCRETGLKARMNKL